MLCVAQNHRLQAHRHCCLTWIFCVKWNMRDYRILLLLVTACAGMYVVKWESSIIDLQIWDKAHLVNSMVYFSKQEYRRTSSSMFSTRWFYQ